MRERVKRGSYLFSAGDQKYQLVVRRDPKGTYFEVWKTTKRPHDVVCAEYDLETLPDKEDVLRSLREHGIDPANLKLKCRTYKR